MIYRKALFASCALGATALSMPAYAQPASTTGSSTAQPTPAEKSAAPAKKAPQQAATVSADTTSQTAASTAPANAAAGEIIVTARRRSENLQDVPISVSAISGDQLQRAGVTDIQGLQYRTPSLSVTSAQSQRNTVTFSLRGQRTQETQLFTDPPVGTYFAEVVQPRPWGFGQALYDLESVQVLKGVQGTLFGRNMTGGAVLVEPRHPRLRSFEGEVRGQIGNHRMRDLFAMLNVPLGDSVAFRLAGKVRRREGWAHEVTTGLDYDNQHYDAFRASALVKPSDRFESYTVFDWFHLHEHGTASFITELGLTPPGASSPCHIAIIGGRPAPINCTPIGIMNLFGSGPTPFLRDSNILDQYNAAQILRRNGFQIDTGIGEGASLGVPNLDVFPKPFEKIRNWGITNKTTYNLTDNLTLKNIFGYRKQSRSQVQDYDGIPAFIITPLQFANTRNLSEELQLQGKAFDNRLTFILGSYYFEEKGRDGSLANTFPQLSLLGAGLDPNASPATEIVTENVGRGYSRTAAAFAAGTYKFAKQFSVSAGIRYNYDKRKITVTAAKPLASTPVCIFDTDLATPGIQTVPIDQCNFTDSKTFHAWTWDGTLQWEPSDRVTAYASVRRGFRAGGYSTRATNFFTLQPFLPEYVTEYEIGLKTNHHFGDALLTTSTALFLQNGTNVQKQRATADPATNQIFTVVTNTAKQRNTGGEFEATLTLPHWSLNAFYSYTKIRILEGAVVLNGLPEIQQRGVPKHQIGGTLTVSPPISPSIGELNLIANATYRSKIWLDDFEVGGLQKAYGLVNLRAELNNIGRTGLSAAVFATNVTNTKYRIGLLGLIAEGVGFSSSVYGEPRMIGAELGYKF